MVWKPVCKKRGRLDGKLAIVTGANTGIGLETVGELARRGCKVILACRSKERMSAAVTTLLERLGSDEHAEINTIPETVEDVTKITPDQLVEMQLDLTSLDSITNFVEEFNKREEQIDLLICNAGIMTCPYGLTKDGFEMQMGTNHFGHCTLTDLLVPKMNNGGRIIVLSSKAHYNAKINLENLEQDEENYGKIVSYCNSKLGNVAYARYLARKLDSKCIKTASVHPGVVNTELSRHLPQGLMKSFGVVAGWALKSPWQGCQTTMECVLSPDLSNGAYYAGCEVTPANTVLDQEGFVDRLMEKTYARIRSTDKGKELSEKLDCFE